MENAKDRGDDVSDIGQNVGFWGQKLFWERVWGGIRRAIFGSFAVIFGLAILLVSILSVTNPEAVHPALSREMRDQESEGKGVVEYYLPYPGVLPDSHLYKLKMVRDRLRLWLTLDGEKKARTELLYADKRINAAIFLVDGGKEALGVTTATKAEKYLESAIDRAVKLSAGGRDVKSLLGVLVTASAKHLEILEELQAKVTGERQEVVAKVWVATKLAHERVGQALAEAK